MVFYISATGEGTGTLGFRTRSNGIGGRDAETDDGCRKQASTPAFSCEVSDVLAGVDGAQGVCPAYRSQGDITSEERTYCGGTRRLVFMEYRAQAIEENCNTHYCTDEARIVCTGFGQLGTPLSDDGSRASDGGTVAASCDHGML